MRRRKPSFIGPRTGSGGPCNSSPKPGRHREPNRPTVAGIKPKLITLITDHHRPFNPRTTARSPSVHVVHSLASTSTASSIAIHIQTRGAIWYCGETIHSLAPPARASKSRSIYCTRDSGQRDSVSYTHPLNCEHPRWITIPTWVTRAVAGWRPHPPVARIHAQRAGADEFTAFLKSYIASWAGRAGVL